METRGDEMWHTWYLVGAAAGSCAALLTITLAARRLVHDGTRDALPSMIWSIVASLLMMPFGGFLVAAAMYGLIR
jgi:phosphate/sulfate permease